MRTLALSTSLVLSLILVPGCPPPEIPNDPDPNDTPSPVSNEQRTVELDHARQMIASVTLDGDPAATEQIAAMLSSMPEFQRVEIHDSNVVARFADGETLVVLNNRANEIPEGAALPADEGITKAPATSRVLRAPKPIDGRAQSADARSQPFDGEVGETHVPESKRAILVNTMGTEFCDSTPTFDEWLSAAGYDVTHVEGTVEGLRNGIRDVGVLYMSAHGSSLPLWAVPQGDGALLTEESNTPLPTIAFPGSDFNNHFVLWTRTVVTNATIDQYRTEVNAGDLVYAVGTTDRVGGSGDCLHRTGGTVLSEMRFVITENFVRKHWTCRPGGLMYIDACSSANSQLYRVCLGPNVNASGFIGWTAPTWDRYSTPTALYFFDRALGANRHPPVRTPPQRPFSAQSLLEVMRRLYRSGLPLDTSEGIRSLHRQETPPLPPPPPPPSPQAPNPKPRELIRSTLIGIFGNGAADVLLRPGIRTVTVADPSGKVTVFGHFGDKPGTVAIDGTALPLTGNGWLSSRIECQAPLSGPGASGAVVVTTAERESNPRRLSEWNLTFQRLFMDFPTQLATNCPACFYEATVHYTIRADVGSSRLLPEDDVTPNGYTGGPSAAGIDVTNAGGSYFIGQGSTITLTANPDDGAAFVGTCIGFSPPADNNFIGGCYRFRGAERMIDFSPTISAEGLLYNYTGGVYDGIVEPVQVIYYGNGLDSVLQLTYSPNFTIEAGNQATGPNSYFEWQAAAAHSPPGLDDPN